MGWLNPAVAAFLMVASGSMVTVNSLRLGRPFEVELDPSAMAVLRSSNGTTMPRIWRDDRAPDKRFRG